MKKRSKTDIYTPEGIRCKHCKETKPATTDFFYKEPMGRLGLKASACIKCHSALSKPRKRPYQLRTKYGLTEEDYNRMYKEQDGCCFLCLTSVARLCVDHDHETGLVRKLLCPRCNRVLGHVEEDSELLRRMATYVEVRGS